MSPRSGTVVDSRGQPPEGPSPTAPKPPRGRRALVLGAAILVGCLGFGAAYLIARPKSTTSPPPGSIVLSNVQRGAVISTPPLSGAVPALARPTATRAVVVTQSYAPAPTVAHTTTQKKPTIVYVTTTFR